MCRQISIVFTAVFAFSLVLGSSALAARSSSDEERLQKLEKAVEALQTRNAELEKEVRQLKHKGQASSKGESYPAGKTITPGADTKAVVTTASEEPPPVDVHPAGPEYKLTLGGYVQANYEVGDVAAFEGRLSDGPNALKDRFRLRRARVTLTGDFAEKFDFKVEGDFEQTDGLATNREGFSATDIFVNYHQFAEANVKVGQYKAPFGLENLTPDTQILTIERSLPTGAIVPERQVGVTIWGKPFANIWPEQKELLTYYAGVYNGNGRNTVVNDNEYFMYVGRLELQPWQGRIFDQTSSIKFGADVYNSRDETGTNISPSLNLKVNADGSLTPYVLASPAERTAWSLDGWLNIGPFDLMGEYFSENVNNRDVAAVTPLFGDFDPNGFYIMGAYYILPKKLQAVVKWEQLNPDQKANDDIHSLTVGLNYYVHGNNIKLMANYIHTWSDFREANPGLGEDQFDEFIMRLQVLF